MKHIAIVVFCLVTLSIVLLTQCAVFSKTVDYNTEVKPILNQKCISCHGGVKQSGGFSLLSEERALEVTESGSPSIIPGSASESEMIRRLTLEDPEERMPYQETPLTGEEINILTRWIDQGANFGLHWSYEPLEPIVEQATMGMVDKKALSIAEEIDAQVSKKLEDLGLSRSPKASKAEILRRVSLGLIGVPPSLSLRRQFLNDEITYDALVDSLLASPAFGEKWTSMWLDIARYADTKGFERDPERSIWLYRDYVIEAFNNDKPYDRFLVEQLAGDLLDNPTDEQYIATGFHRNTQTNDEGGTDNEEFRVQAVMDRVSTTWEGILGTTMACVQCHGHPYDPFPQEDYYSTYAFFNNTRDADTYLDYPRLKLLDSLDSQDLAELTDWISEVDSDMRAKEIREFVKTTQPVIYSIEVTDITDGDLYDTKYLGLRKNGYAKIESVNLSGKERFWTTIRNARKGGILTLSLEKPGGRELATWKTGAKDVGSKLLDLPIKATEGVHDVYLSYQNQNLKNPDAQGISFDWFTFSSAFPMEGSDIGNKQKDKFKGLVQKGNGATLIMYENPADLRRESFVFDRGNWQMHKKNIEPAVPSILPELNNENPSRLDFAEWIADESNPLTARTYVNRIWEQLFGRGIARTVEDLGSQGEAPSHLQLLDYLAREFMYTQEWSTKQLIKSIVLSDTYQQAAKSKQNDPGNINLSSGPRFRLSAEQIRDQGLAVAGILSGKIYGKPVMPPQPEGIWKSPYSGDQWIESEGEDKYRRALYTFVKRTAIYPSFETYDMAQRQVCSSRRIRTNTPLQALVTLNDPVYMEASRKLASQMMAVDGTLEDKINWGYEVGMFKPIDPGKLQVLKQLFLDTKSEIEQTTEIKEKIETEEELTHIAFTSVANALLNLDEMLNN